jgi:D-alanine-D-alanine ligase
MPSARVLVLFNEPILPAGDPDFASEIEILETVMIVEGQLRDAGFTVERFGLGADALSLLETLRKSSPDAVFNLFEGPVGRGDSEAHVTGILEWLGVPFTGCPAQALSLGRSKHLSKLLFQGAGLPTPRFLVVDRLPVPTCPIPWPVIVKPAKEDASSGLTQASVVTNDINLAGRAAEVLGRYGPPVLVEEFIDGRELNVALAEVPHLQTLCISEVLFTQTRHGTWPIVTYDAKWRPGSADYDSTPAEYPANVSSDLALKLQRVAERAFRLLGCRDYARADFRVGADGTPYLLEVNPNPDYHPEAGFARGLACAGWRHADFTVALVENSLRRNQ